MRVYISGVGMISALGIGAEHNWQRILNGETNIQPIPEHWSEYMDFQSLYYSPIDRMDYSKHGFLRSEIIQRDPASLHSIVATQEALNAAGFETKLTNKKLNQHTIAGIDSKRVSVNYGTGWGGGNSILSNHSHHLLNKNVAKLKEQIHASNETDMLDDVFKFPTRYNPFVVSMLICNSVPASIATKFKLHGEVRPSVHACASGTSSLVQAAEMIKTNKADIVIAGGSDFLNDEYGASHYCFDVAQTLVKTPNDCNPSKINRPFDKERSGFLFSEGGAATLIVESEENIEKRGGTPIAEITGYSETFDAHSIMAPEPSGKQIERMIKKSLVMANTKANEIDYINSHGTGTTANDQTEAEVIERIFGNDVAINSTKSILGHTIGASGAIEAIVSALSIRDQELHPSLNLENPIADLDFVTERRKQKVDSVLSHSFAFGGHNSGIVLGKV